MSIYNARKKKEGFVEDLFEWACKNANKIETAKEDEEYQAKRFYIGKHCEPVMFDKRMNGVMFAGKKATFTSDILIGAQLPNLIHYLNSLSEKVSEVIFNMNDMIIEEKVCLKVSEYRGVQVTFEKTNLMKEITPKMSIPPFEDSMRNYFKRLCSSHLLTNAKMSIQGYCCSITLQTKFEYIPTTFEEMIDFNLCKTVVEAETYDAITVEIQYDGDETIFVKVGEKRKTSYIKLDSIELSLEDFWHVVESVANRSCSFSLYPIIAIEDWDRNEIYAVRRWRKLLPGFMV